MVPMPLGLNHQVTAVSLVFATVAVNCRVCPLLSVALAGLTFTDTEGVRVMLADADLVGSAWLVAVTVTVCGAAMVSGAVYNPEALIAPTPLGLNHQVTAVLLVLATVAVNCWGLPASSVALAGATLTAMPGTRVTAAEADLVGSAWLVAVTVTTCCTATPAGAV